MAAGNEFKLSKSEQVSYENIFSSILTPFTSLTVGEEIGQGEWVSINFQIINMLSDLEKDWRCVYIYIIKYICIL